MLPNLSSLSIRSPPENGSIETATGTWSNRAQVTPQVTPVWRPPHAWDNTPAAQQVQETITQARVGARTNQAALDRARAAAVRAARLRAQASSTRVQLLEVQARLVAQPVDARISNTAAELARLREQLAMETRNAEAAAATANQATAELAQVRRQLAETREELRAASRIAVQANAETAEAKALLELVKAELEQAIKDAAATETAIEDVRTQVRRMQTERVEEQQRITSLQEQLEAAEDSHQNTLAEKLLAELAAAARDEQRQAEQAVELAQKDTELRALRQALADCEVREQHGMEGQNEEFKRARVFDKYTWEDRVQHSLKAARETFKAARAKAQACDDFTPLSKERLSRWNRGIETVARKQWTWAFEYEAKEEREILIEQMEEVGWELAKKNYKIIGSIWDKMWCPSAERTEEELKMNRYLFLKENQAEYEPIVRRAMAKQEQAKGIIVPYTELIAACFYGYNKFMCHAQHVLYESLPGAGTTPSERCTLLKAMEETEEVQKEATKKEKQKYYEGTDNQWLFRDNEAAAMETSAP